MWLWRSRVSNREKNNNTEEWVERKNKENEFSILSYNVDCDSNSHLVAEAVIQSKADIVCIQENNEYRERQFNDYPEIATYYPHQQWFPPKVCFI